MTQQLTELIREFHELKLRDNTKLFEDAAGTLFVLAEGATKVLKVKGGGPELAVTTLSLEEFAKFAPALTPVFRNSQRGGD
jgi:hypothetical protein